jgi:hypothetical protein
VSVLPCRCYTLNCGGWQWVLTHNAPASTSRSWFIRNRSTVALPVGVKPCTRRAFSIDMKCSCQHCERGLNKGNVAPVTEFRAAESLALLRLQLRQARHKFSGASPPWRSICSTCIAWPIVSRHVWQYSQQFRARPCTKRTMAACDTSFIRLRLAIAAATRLQ